MMLEACTTLFTYRSKRTFRPLAPQPDFSRFINESLDCATTRTALTSSGLGHDLSTTRLMDLESFKEPQGPALLALGSSQAPHVWPGHGQVEIGHLVAPQYDKTL